jgi:hypothetical protein
MELGEEHGRRGAVEDPRQELGSGLDPPVGDGVEEGPRRGGHGLGDERPDVVAADRSAGAVERQLVELADREHPHPASIDVGLVHEAADARRKLLGGPRLEAQPSLSSPCLDPGGELAFLGRRQLLRLAAGRGHGSPQVLEALRSLAAGRAVDRVEEDEAVAGSDPGDDGREGVLAGPVADQRTGLDDRDERSASEQRRGRDELHELLGSRAGARDPPASGGIPPASARRSARRSAAFSRPYPSSPQK